VEAPGDGTATGGIATSPVVFERGRTGRFRGRAPVVAWLATLVAIVGQAGAGRLTESPATVTRAAAIQFALPSGHAAPEPAPTTVPAAPAVATPELIVLASPAQAGMTVTTRDLVVQGYLQAGAEHVRVTLEARGNRVIDDATVVPALATNDGPIASRLPRFEVRFGLPNPRPNGRMIVQVAAYDGDGRMLDVIRRPFRVGRLIEPGGA
jgi:hypothetical protein